MSRKLASTISRNVSQARRGGIARGGDPEAESLPLPVAPPPRCCELACPVATCPSVRSTLRCVAQRSERRRLAERAVDNWELTRAKQSSQNRKSDVPEQSPNPEKTLPSHVPLTGNPSAVLGLPSCILHSLLSLTTCR